MATGLENVVVMLIGTLIFGIIGVTLTFVGCAIVISMKKPKEISLIVLVGSIGTFSLWSLYGGIFGFILVLFADATNISLNAAGYFVTWPKLIHYSFL
jgi:hypothetical protein